MFRKQEELLKLAYSLESKSEHPLAKAIVAYGTEKHTEQIPVTEFKALPGNGLEGKAGEADVKGGSLKFAQSQTEISEKIRLQAEKLAEEGVFVVINYRGNEEQAKQVQQTIKEQGGNAGIYGCDVSDFSAEGN